jgi:glycosyltransferase involved in cell wall biosynthesis
MEYILAYHSINSCGGGEKVLFETARAIKEYCESPKVTLYLIDKPKRLKFYGNLVKYIDEIFYMFDSLTPITLKYNMLMSVVLRKLSDSRVCLLNINGLTSNILPHLTYVHYPFIYEQMISSTPLEKCYAKMNAIIADVINKLLPEEPRVLLFNSLYTLKKTTEYIIKFKGITPVTLDIFNKSKKLIIYPPVDVEKIQNNIKYDKYNNIVVISRFDRNKYIERAIFIMHAMTSMFHTKDVKMHIIGSLNDISYLTQLIELTRKLDLEKNIAFHVNATEYEKLDILSKAKVYLHPLEGEHFGISIVEGMAAGLIPVVPSIGGPTEFVSKEWWYKSITEGAAKVITALERWSPKEAAYFSKKANLFSASKFRQKISEIACQIATQI